MKDRWLSLKKKTKKNMYIQGYAMKNNNNKKNTLLETISSHFPKISKETIKPDTSIVSVATGSEEGMRSTLSTTDTLLLLKVWF